MNTKAQAEAMAREIVETAHIHVPSESDRETCERCGNNFRAHLAWDETLQSRISTALEKLLADNERLKKERDIAEKEKDQAWKESIARVPLSEQEIKDFVKIQLLQSQLTATESRLETMKDGARKYIPKLHLAGCGVFDTDVVKCTCGLSAFLSTLTAEKKEEGK